MLEPPAPGCLQSPPHPKSTPIILSLLLSLSNHRDHLCLHHKTWEPREDKWISHLVLQSPSHQRYHHCDLLGHISELVIAIMTVILTITIIIRHNANFQKAGVSCSWKSAECTSSCSCICVYILCYRNSLVFGFFLTFQKGKQVLLVQTLALIHLLPKVKDISPPREQVPVL